MSATIGASPEPEQPTVAASAMQPVLEQDAHTNGSGPALAEDPAPEPQEIGGEPSGSSMIVFEGVQKIYEPSVTALDGEGLPIGHVRGTDGERPSYESERFYVLPDGDYDSDHAQEGAGRPRAGHRPYAAGGQT